MRPEQTSVAKHDCTRGQASDQNVRARAYNRAHRGQRAMYHAVHAILEVSGLGSLDRALDGARSGVATPHGAGSNGLRGSENLYRSHYMRSAWPQSQRKHRQTNRKTREKRSLGSWKMQAYKLQMRGSTPK